MSRLFIRYDIKRGTVLKIFEIIENILNSLIIAVAKMLAKLIPSPLKNLTQHIFSIINQKIKNIMKYTAKLLPKLFGFIKFVPTKSQVLLSTIIDKSVVTAKKIKSNPIRPSSFSKWFTALITFLALWGGKIQKWYIGLKPTTIALSIATTAAVTIAGLNIYSSGKSIYDKSKEKKVSQVVLPAHLRAGYYKQSERHLLVSGVTLPIYVGTGNAPRTLIIDFTMQMSNRYLTSYFYDNDYMLKDRLNSHFEPVVPTLPLEEEGKRIIKEKIIEETNKLIKLKGIKGEVEDIFIHTIING